MKIKMKKIKKTHLLFPNYIKYKKSPLKRNEYSKESLIRRETREDMKYKPINPKRTFNPSTIGINEIVKKNNLSLITNYKIRNIIIKFREERQKEIEEKKILYKNRSFHNYEEEKKTHFIMLKAMLRKDHQTIQNLIKREHKNQDKKIKNRCSSSRNLSYLSNISSKKYRYKSSSPLILSDTKNTTKNSNNKSLVIKNIKNDILNEDLFPKLEKKNTQKIQKKNEIKIKNASSMTIGGKITNHNKTTNFPHKKFNQDISFSLLNINSEKLGEISLFGVLDGNGPMGKQIASIVKDYIIDYFKNGTDMKVTLKRDNFYSIMYYSFNNAQNYLINNCSKLNINLDYSGVTGCILLYPQNNRNKVYCANLGRNKCMLYSMFGTVRLSYELYPDRASEKYRISLVPKKKDKTIITNNNNEKMANLNKSEEINNIINNSEKKNNNIINEIYKDNNNQKQNENTKSKIDEKDKENYLKDFLELDISRCIGNLIAEDHGIIPGPEVVESDIRINKGKYIVMGTPSLWKYLTDEEIGEIVNKYLAIGDSVAACKELEETAKERWKSDMGGYDDISVVVIFFDLKNIDVIK